MKLFARLFTLLVLPAALFAESTIVGRVTLPPKQTAAVMKKRYEIVSTGGVVATNPPVAIVYLEGTFPPSSALPIEKVAQKDYTFIPSVLPIRTGTRVEFPNEDDTYHNVFSYSPPKRFDLGRYRPDERPVPSEVFDKPGLVTLRCDIHEHMRAIILVVDTPYFVVTDTDGNFRLTGMPPGRYTLKAWLSSKTTLERPVDVSADATVQADFP